MNFEYDIVIVGGGVAGSALATVMAKQHARVLVIEREHAFRDRVRGEWLAPWGTSEAGRLGLLPALERAGALATPWNISRSGKPREQRTPAGDPPLGFYHPAVQEELLRTAEATGARVVRGGTVQTLEPGSPAIVRYRAGTETVETRARLVVAADGRNSVGRRALAKPERQHRSDRLLAGVRVGNLCGAADTNHFLIRPGAAGLAMLYRQRNGFGRAYLFLPGDDRATFGGEGGFRRFIEMSIASGIPREVLGEATQEGPLAAFVTSDSWVDAPYREGLVLIGDAAGISDPTWGMGIALAFRDVRILSDALAGEEDWTRALAVYGKEHDRYFASIRTVENWHTELLLTPGADADERRRHAVREWAADPSRVPDLHGIGPEVDTSRAARRRFFGEDVADREAGDQSEAGKAERARALAATR